MKMSAEDLEARRQMWGGMRTLDEYPLDVQHEVMTRVMDSCQKRATALRAIGMKTSDDDHWPVLLAAFCRIVELENREAERAQQATEPRRRGEKLPDWDVSIAELVRSGRLNTGGK